MGYLDQTAYTVYYRRLPGTPAPLGNLSGFGWRPPQWRRKSCWERNLSATVDKLVREGYEVRPVLANTDADYAMERELILPQRG